jgi:pyridoxamine 5'-phosphate oxidase
MQNTADIRIEYKQQTLLESEVATNPFTQFEKWWADAVNSKIEEVNAMTLATVTKDGLPAARIILLKGFSEEGFTFFTNYKSHKGEQLLQNPQACLVFFWKELERQIRIIGNREILENNTKALEEKYALENKIERPPHWGGYIVQPNQIEFWQGRPSRLHDRIQYTKREDGNWIIERLAP